MRRAFNRSGLRPLTMKLIVILLIIMALTVAPFAALVALRIVGALMVPWYVISGYLILALLFWWFLFRLISAVDIG